MCTKKCVDVSYQPSKSSSKNCHGPPDVRPAARCPQTVRTKPRSISSGGEPSPVKVLALVGLQHHDLDIPLQRDQFPQGRPGPGAVGSGDVRLCGSSASGS